MNKKNKKLFSIILIIIIIFLAIYLAYLDIFQKERPTISIYLSLPAFWLMLPIFMCLIYILYTTVTID
jgi:hypothetical protein